MFRKGHKSIPSDVQTFTHKKLTYKNNFSDRKAYRHPLYADARLNNKSLLDISLVLSMNIKILTFETFYLKNIIKRQSIAFNLFFWTRLLLNKVYVYVYL